MPGICDGLLTYHSSHRSCKSIPSLPALSTSTPCQHVNIGLSFPCPTSPGTKHKGNPQAYSGCLGMSPHITMCPASAIPQIPGMSTCKPLLYIQRQWPAPLQVTLARPNEFDNLIWSLVQRFPNSLILIFILDYYKVSKFSVFPQYPSLPSLLL